MEGPTASRPVQLADSETAESSKTTLAVYLPACGALPNMLWWTRGCPIIPARKKQISTDKDRSEDTDDAAR